MTGCVRSKTRTARRRNSAALKEDKTPLVAAAEIVMEAISARDEMSTATISDIPRTHHKLDCTCGKSKREPLVEIEDRHRWFDDGNDGPAAREE